VVQTTSRIGAAQLGAWRLFLRAHSQITKRLEADLLAEQEIPLASYDVLLQLGEAPDRRLKMTELADRVMLSRSGLTRLVDRLSAEGLVERAACPGDARVTYAVLTDAGLQRLRTAAPTHLRGVADYVTDRLTDDELAQLKERMAKLLTDPLEGPAGGCGEAEGL
jgi:DNA-binding MarR family transcriptional regulator